MNCLWRGTLLGTACVALAPTVCAFVLVDDFQVGDYHSVINWPNNHDGHKLSGLDKAHSAFGQRGADVIVDTNFDRVPVFVDFGEGQARISYDSPSGDIATDTSILFGNVPGLNLDLSAETEIWVDLFTEDPPNRLADQWSITIADGDGHSSTNPGFITRFGGIRFKRSGFASNIDWSRINNILFRQKFSPDSGDVPMSYTVTKVYMVPEPDLLLTGLGGIVILAWRRRRSAVSRASAPCRCR